MNESINVTGPALKTRIAPLILLIAMSASLASVSPRSLELISDEIVAKHMAEKHIPGMSVAIVQNGDLVFSKGYGKSSVEFNIAATADTVYPISSVSRTFAGLLALRLEDQGLLDLDAPISAYGIDLPADKQSISVRHLLQHTHGLEDFYHSDDYVVDTGKSMDDSTTEELISWSLSQPLQSQPGDAWAYGLAGYVILAQIFERVGERPFTELVDQYVLQPLDITATYGGSDVLVDGRNPVLYEWLDDDLIGHVIGFSPRVYAAGGLNISVTEMARVFAALSGDSFIDSDAKKNLWRNVDLANGKASYYGLGWSSYTTSKDRWVVGHEGGGASWVIYYPDQDLAVIALSNMSGARADVLPYEIARAAFAAGLVSE